MWDIIKGIDLPLIIGIIVGFNAVLVGLRKILEIIKDKTDTNIDNKAYEILGKAADFLLKIIDIIGSNPKNG